MFPSTIIIETICLAFAIVYLRKSRNWPRFFIPFMIFVLLVEMPGYTMAILSIRNHWMYNVELLAEILFLSWVFLQVFGEIGARARTLLLPGTILSVLSFLAESIYYRFQHYSDKTSILVSLIFIIYSGMYFYRLMLLPTYINLLRFHSFWIVAGIFLFYFSSSAVNIFFDDLMRMNIAGGIPLRYLIFTLLNAILYGCWSYAFRCYYLQTISPSR